VRVEKLGGLTLEDVTSRDPDNQDDEDDDFPSFRYYESEKILGKLYRAIDERKLFEQIQERALTDSAKDESTVMNAVWEYVQEACMLIEWKHNEEWARDIRDMYVLSVTFSPLTCLLMIP